MQGYRPATVPNSRQTGRARFEPGLQAGAEPPPGRWTHRFVRLQARRSVQRESGVAGEVTVRDFELATGLLQLCERIRRRDRGPRQVRHRRRAEGHEMMRPLEMPQQAPGTQLIDRLGTARQVAAARSRQAGKRVQRGPGVAEHGPGQRARGAGKRCGNRVDLRSGQL